VDAYAVVLTDHVQKPIMQLFGISILAVHVDSPSLLSTKKEFELDAIAASCSPQSHDGHIRSSEQFLNDFRVLAVGVQNSAERVTKRMSTDMLSPIFFAAGFDVTRKIELGHHGSS